MPLIFSTNWIGVCTFPAGIIPTDQRLARISDFEGRQDGFVATLIPIGMHVRCRTLGDKEAYYIRAGSSFVPTSTRAYKTARRLA